VVEVVEVVEAEEGGPVDSKRTTSAWMSTYL
jgi:hypothetical protein